MLERIWASLRPEKEQTSRPYNEYCLEASIRSGTRVIKQSACNYLDVVRYHGPLAMPYEITAAQSKETLQLSDRMAALMAIAILQHVPVLTTMADPEIVDKLNELVHNLKSCNVIK